ncbi:MAG: NUDIX hydrolase [Candidatus Cloacimonadaceae bacterium]|nr:NUDIX hydrolase [Candidatus Cloacimonadaceae bacterium]MDP3113174.1 NUDIX hydrolase [Candidatus Cloacimonadaceae bacterium]
MDNHHDLYENVNYCIRCGSALETRFEHEDKPRPICPSCGWVYYLNPVPAVAVVALNENYELLLIKRKFAPKAGEWALPSGYMEIDMTPEENALSELREETGLIGSISHCISWHFGSSPIYHRILSIGFRVTIEGGTLCAADDAEEAKFFPLDCLPPIAFASHREFIHLETNGSTK